MNAGRADLIAVVEAAYDLHSDDQAWLNTLTERAAGVIDRGGGVVSYRYVYDAQAPFVDLTGHTSNVPPVVVAGLDTYAQALRDPAHRLHTFYRWLIHQYRLQPADNLLLSEWEFAAQAPSEAVDLGGDDVQELIYLRADRVDGASAVVLASNVPPGFRLRPAERDMLHRLGAHIKAGARLRQAAASEQGVLDPVGRVLHAEGEARDALTELSEAAVRIDQARTARCGRHAEALAAWEGLIDGRWSLVERIDTDGKRLLVVHENPAQVPDPRGLTPMERAVVALAVKGQADKLIAYHLGLAMGTVSGHLTRAMHKLQVRNRVELVRLLAGRLGQLGA